MAPTGAGEGGSAPGTKIKGKSKTKSVRHLLAPPTALAVASAPATTASPAAGTNLGPIA